MTFRPAIQSSATEADIELYTAGSCHAFALALHRKHGMRMLVILNPDQHCWDDPADADNFICNVVHVYAIDANGVAWDVRGARPLDAIKAEILEIHPDLIAIDEDESVTEAGMTTYIDGCGSPDIDRPLHRLEDKDIREAEACAERVLDGLLMPAASAAP